ncbi:MAG: protein-disulfide reductase DsbD family protein [Verrucomicrobiota bacterium]
MHLYSVRFVLNVLVAALFCLTSVAKAAHTQADLLLSSKIAKPGDTVLAGIHLRMDPEWHTYWKNSGASGIPTTLAWTLPPGITNDSIEWPTPKKLPPDELTTYIYDNEVVLIVPLHLSSDLKPGSYTLKAKASWLECKEQCLPGDAELQAVLTVGSESKPSAKANLIQTWQSKLPKQSADLNVRAGWEKPISDKLRPVVLEWNSPHDVSDADFYPLASDGFEVQGATERLPAEAGKIRLRKLVSKFQGDWPKQLSGVLVQTAIARTGYEITVPISKQAPEGSLTALEFTASPASNGLTQPLWKMLLYAFVGGLILNIMPCVLPVIALKILGFVGEARNAPKQVRKLGLIYGLGVLVSFLALAGLVIAVKAAGHKAGWGMQFGNPQFLVVLTVLVTLVALNLFGLFEINLGGKVMGAAGNAASRHGSAGAFFNGILATVLATPCTAPFLGAALGFAFAQSALIIALIFLTVGVGLAFPYVILSWQPAWLKFLPKPGAWMERFKILMGFPMLATAVWLFSLIPLHYGKRSWWLGIFLVIVALAAWIYGEFVQRGRTRRGLALGIFAALLIGGYFYTVEGELNWREPARTENAGSLKESESGIDWQRWSPAAVMQARAQGHPVLVDFTADWCLTCQANKKIALEIPSVQAKLKAINAVALLGDYTHLPDEITTELNRYNRAGVPLVLIFPKAADAPPIVLPELLTPNIVLDALERAAR